MWFIGVDVEHETSAPPPKKNPGSAPVEYHSWHVPDEALAAYVMYDNNLQVKRDSPCHSVSQFKG